MRRKKRFKQFVARILFVLLGLLLVWVLGSYLEIIIKNVRPDPEYSWLNVMNLFI